GWDVYPVNLAAATIEGLPAYPSILAVPVDIERATVYLRPEGTLRVLDEIARKHVRELFLNPGREDDSGMARAAARGLTPILACSIVDIGRNPADPEG